MCYWNWLNQNNTQSSLYACIYSVCLLNQLNLMWYRSHPMHHPSVYVYWNQLKQNITQSSLYASICSVCLWNQLNLMRYRFHPMHHPSVYVFWNRLNQIKIQSSLYASFSSYASSIDICFLELTRTEQDPVFIICIHL